LIETEEDHTLLTRFSVKSDLFPTIAICRRKNTENANQPEEAYDAQLQEAETEQPWFSALRSNRPEMQSNGEQDTHLQAAGAEALVLQLLHPVVLHLLERVLLRMQRGEEELGMRREAGKYTAGFQR
jgi:hypothetical protein